MRAGSPWNATRSAASSSHRLEQAVAGEQPPQLLVDGRDVGRVAGERCPPERADAAAEERPDIGRDEARVCECVLDSCLERLPSQVVAIVENIAAVPDELEHGVDMDGDGLARQPQVLIGIALPEARRFLERKLARDVPDQGVVCGRLIRDEVELLPATGELGVDQRGVAEQGNRQRAPFGRRCANSSEGLVEGLRRLVEVPGLQTPLDARRVDLDAENRSAGHRRGQWLGAAHAAEPGGQDRPAGEIR